MSTEHVRTDDSSTGPAGPAGPVTPAAPVMPPGREPVAVPAQPGEAVLAEAVLADAVLADAVPADPLPGEAVLAEAGLADAGPAAAQTGPPEGLPVRGSRGRHAGPAAGTPAIAPGSVLASWLRRLAALARAFPLATAGVIILVAMAAFCFAGPLLYHTDQVHVFTRIENLSPGAGHPLGTDANGDDILGRLMVGGQASLLVGAAAGVLAAILGSLWGAIAGYAGGALDAVMMRLVDAGIAIPTVVAALVIVSVDRPTEPVLVVVVAATSWLGTARLVRGEALALRSREYVQAVRVMGGGGWRAVLRHIMPNAFGTIAVNVTFQIGGAILTLATLSYLGLGVQSPAVDWGNMIWLADQTIDLGYWWQIVPPGLAIMLVVVAFTMLGDGLRDGLRREPARAGGNRAGGNNAGGNRAGGNSAGGKSAGGRGAGR
jgi:peptide/nickel transport system permease protein